jgi:hypothetical protein
VEKYGSESPLEGSTVVMPICTCIAKRQYERRLRNGTYRTIGEVPCNDEAVIEAYNPLTGDTYYCCKAHWTDAALHTADRMGLKYRKVNDERDERHERADGEEK